VLLTSLDPAQPPRFRRLNDAMCAITGYTCVELTLRTFTDVTYAKDAIGLTRSLQR
jgi:hypothetical protein